MSNGRNLQGSERLKIFSAKILSFFLYLRVKHMKRDESHVTKRVLSVGWMHIEAEEGQIKEG